VVVVKTDLRWQLLLVVAGLTLIWSLVTAREPEPVAEPTPLPAVTLPVTRESDGCSAVQPMTGGILTEGVMGAPRHPTPLLAAGNPVDELIVDLVFDGLVRLDGQAIPQPALATGWTVSEDGLTWQFTLRDGVRWHDGAPFSADDVLFTWRLLADPALPGGPHPVWQAVQSRALDPLTVELTLPEPWSPILAATAQGIVPAHLLAGIPAAETGSGAFNNRPIGTAPWRVANNWSQDGFLQLEPNPDQWPTLPPITALTWHFYPDQDELIAALALGRIHTILSVDSAGLPDVAAIPDVRLFTFPANRYTQLLFNVAPQGGSLLESLALREALAQATDRPALIRTALNGQGIPFDGPFLPTWWAYNPNPAQARQSADAEAAATALNAAGWRFDGTDPIRSRATDGEERQSLTLRLLTSDNQLQTTLARTLQAQWAAVGIGSEIVALPPAAWLAALEAGEFDLALMEVRPGNDPDLYSFWSQEAIVRGQNYGGWNDRRASEALEAARQTADLKERLGYYDAFSVRFAAALPALPLFQHVQSHALGNRVYGAEIGRFATPRDRYATFGSWYLETAPVPVPCP
jgi:peptide/nickel transport system substrate-binding protein